MPPRPFIPVPIPSTEERVSKIRRDAGPFFQQVIDEISAALERPLGPEEMDLIGKRFQVELNTPKPVAQIAQDAIASFLPLFREQDIKGQTKKQQEELTKLFEEEFTTREKELLQEQDLERAFLAEGGVATPQTLAQLAGATTEEEARNIALQSIQAQEAQQAALEQQFLSERQALGEELSGIGARELELAQPQIEQRLQELGILRGGERIRQTQEAAERLEAQRQRILAGFGREDVLQRRTLAEQFGQQARGLALEEQERLRGGLEGLFGTRLGVTREDITTGRERQFRAGESALERQFRSSEAERQRQFERELEQARIQRANELADLQRRQQRGGVLGQLFGGLGGAGLGALLALPTGGLSVATGALLGGGLGSTLGGAFGGSGGSSLGGSLLQEGLLRGRTPTRLASTPTSLTGSSGFIGNPNLSLFGFTPRPGGLR